MWDHLTYIRRIINIRTGNIKRSMQRTASPLLFGKCHMWPKLHWLTESWQIYVKDGHLAGATAHKDQKKNNGGNHNHPNPLYLAREGKTDSSLQDPNPNPKNPERPLTCEVATDNSFFCAFL